MLDDISDPALSPVTPSALQEMLDHDLAKAVESGPLSPHTGGGVTIGILENGVRRVFSYGAAVPESLFEIGSITKPVTGLIFAQMVEQGLVRLEEPVRELLPVGLVDKHDGPEVTLLDLATHQSGLPSWPDNVHPDARGGSCPDCVLPTLYEYVSHRGLAKPDCIAVKYSNFGYALLGQALADRAGTSYEELLQEFICRPMGLENTSSALSPKMQNRVIQGHDHHHLPVPASDLGAFVGAGGIRSTVGEMLTYLEANLHPERLKASVDSKSSASLPYAIRQTHILHADAGPDTRIALAWSKEADTGDYGHLGITAGFSSCAVFNHTRDYAVVVLFNTTVVASGNFPYRLAMHITQRMTGRPAVSLEQRAA